MVGYAYRMGEIRHIFKIKDGNLKKEYSIKEQQVHE